MYAVPTWGSPVGDGATRSRTGPLSLMMAPGYGPASFPRDHGVRQRADALDLDVDALTSGDRADARGGTGEDHVARQQGEGLRRVGHQRGDVVHHLAGAAVLHGLAVATRADRQV